MGTLEVAHNYNAVKTKITKRNNRNYIILLTLAVRSWVLLTQSSMFKVPKTVFLQKFRVVTIGNFVIKKTID